MTEHICCVCFRPSREHNDPGFWTPRCCAGCGCGEEQPEGEPCTCTLACEPAGITEEQFCRLAGSP